LGSRSIFRITLRAVILCLVPAFVASAATPAAADAGACGYLLRSMAAQPAGAVLLASYPSEHRGVLSKAAYTYDNAVTAIALVGCGQVAQAQRIGDALLLAQDHDRYWHDGRLRNGYAAGAVGTGPIRLPGWWDPKAKRWMEDAYQAGSDSGNMAWAMLALLALHAASGEPRYRDGALRLARWVDGMLDARGAGGFVGGYLGNEPAPQRLQWKSTEHNTDLAAAFGLLARVSGDAHWLQRAALASGFVDAMWLPACGCFAVGSGEDGVSINPLLALDAQAWPLLALPGMAERQAAVLATIDARLRFGDGYTYSQAGGGLWTEGSAQVLLLRRLVHPQAPTQALRAAIDTERTPNGGYFASGAPATPTGFMLATDPSQPRVYFHLEHLGAAAWVALAQQDYDPFTGGRSLPR
jgi:hypothetical protein